MTFAHATTSWLPDAGMDEDEDHDTGDTHDMAAGPALIAQQSGSAFARKPEHLLLLKTPYLVGSYWGRGDAIPAVQ